MLTRHLKQFVKYIIRIILIVPRALESRFKRSPRVVFYSPASFQAQHLYPVIQHIIDQNVQWELVLIGDFDSKFGVCYYNQLSDFPIYKTIDIYISTEMVLPWWLDAIKIFFGHGVGPKIDYQEKYRTSGFDISFSPCLPIYKAHLKPRNRNKAEPCKIGLPVLDAYINGSVKIKKSFICDFFQVPTNQPILVYAPSWNSDPDLNSNFDVIIGELKKCKGMSLIVSPHPNLLTNSINGRLSDFCRYGVAINTKYSTLDLCAAADVVISDISSVMFESIAMKKTVVFDGNRKVYSMYGADYVLSMVEASLPRINWEGDVCCQLKKIIEQYKDTDGDEFRSKYFFNLGDSTMVFVDSIESILHGVISKSNRSPS